MSAQTHRQLAEKATQSVFEASKRVNLQFRQQYHFMAPAYWINDPNGLIQYRGKYHLFYQHNPYAAAWGPMHWGHAVSTDLLHWKHLPVALAPSDVYENGGGCFSGSAVEANNRLLLFYTGDFTEGGTRGEAQCLASSEDGIYFEKHANNPVLKRTGVETKNFRDPKVWKHGDSWYMAVASCKNNSGEVLLYHSDDLVQWNEKGVMISGYGKMGNMWECPDFFELSGKDVLLFSPIGFENRKACYLTGKLNYETCTFTSEGFGESDWGFDYYAAQSLLDAKSRRIMIGWANSWKWMPWFNGYEPTQKDLWCGYMSIPREVSLCSDGKLSFQPVEEMKQLHINARELTKCLVEAEVPLAVLAGDGVCYELVAEFDLTKSNATSFGFLLRCSGGEKTVIECDMESGELLFDRSSSDGFSKGIKCCTLESCSKDILRLHIFSDTCSIEIFADEGRTAMCSSIYPSRDSNKTFLFAKGGTVWINRIQSWGLSGCRDDISERSMETSL